MKYNGFLTSLVATHFIVVFMVGLHYTLHHMVGTLRSFNYSSINMVLILMKTHVMFLLINQTIAITLLYCTQQWGGHFDLVKFFIERNCNPFHINIDTCQSGELTLVHKLESLDLFSPDDTTKIDMVGLHFILLHGMLHHQLLSILLVFKNKIKY
uniref:Transmembrane protein n=1 Tax=Amphimedon queenslandica TaxID=400682 RepID=A0A1X7SYR6_AMPQE